MQTIAGRIRELINKENLTNKQFAERIEINPSIVSHILSGRNKVSLQVIESIKKAFTNVNLDYLLLGTGALFQEITNVNNIESTSSQTESEALSIEEPKEADPNDVIDTKDNSLNKSNQIQEPVPYSTESPQENPAGQTSDIERIVIFFKDGTFKSYKS